MPPIENTLFDQVGLDSDFAEDEADEAGMRAERVVVEVRHLARAGSVARVSAGGNAPAERTRGRGIERRHAPV